MTVEALPISTARSIGLTAAAMLAFAGNSLLCRLALRQSAIDANTFTAVRLIAGALVLTLWVRMRRPGHQGNGSTDRKGDWISAAALFVYAMGFSWAYVTLPAATGALLLFGAVQATMVGFGLWRGERLTWLQTAGALAACAGLVFMLLPGVQAPSPGGSMLMIGAGVAWGVYSLRGRGATDPVAVTAGNFVRASVLAIVVSLASFSTAAVDTAGFAYAVASGALASGVGYSVWYAAIRGLSNTSAAAVQLTVPVIAALAAVGVLGEPITFRLMLTACIVLGGVGLVIAGRRTGSKLR